MEVRLTNSFYLQFNVAIFRYGQAVRTLWFWAGTFKMNGSSTVYTFVGTRAFLIN